MAAKNHNRVWTSPGELCRVRTLNVAGNSEKTSPGIFKEAYVYLGKVFRAIAIAKMRE